MGLRADNNITYRIHTHTHTHTRKNAHTIFAKLYFAIQEGEYILVYIQIFACTKFGGPGFIREHCETFSLVKDVCSNLP